MSKILYVSDLDGTLMNSEQKISGFSVDVINKLVNNGMLFSYATARSKVTASKITKDITVPIPVIVYNGAFILDNLTEKILFANFFKPNEISEIFESLIKNEIYPITYSYINGAEKFSYFTDKINIEMQQFLDTRKGDVRDNPINCIKDLCTGQPFYFTCIDTEEKLYPLYQKFMDKYSCVYQKDIYSGAWWLEIMPPETSKANAIMQLKKLPGVEKIVSFGDGKNDIPMFRLSDECYAVENADEELKAIATDIISGNNNDGVAKWLLANAIL